MINQMRLKLSGLRLKFISISNGILKISLKRNANSKAPKKKQTNIRCTYLNVTKNGLKKPPISSITDLGSIVTTTILSNLVIVRHLLNMRFREFKKKLLRPRKAHLSSMKMDLISDK